ncbi:MAG TPA: hypothetical protein VN666_07445 [Nitrospira sp.]|nr:hypothetical protein [Nitrospira sp.]
MPSHHRLENKLHHDIDITGIAVALAFLVSVAVFAGGHDNRSATKDGQSPSASMQIAPTLTMEKTETLQHPDDDPDLSDTSRGLTAFR